MKHSPIPDKLWCRVDAGATTTTSFASLPPDLVKLFRASPAWHDALVKIEEGRGRFSRDELTHANNTIEDMKELARSALALLEE